MYAYLPSKIAGTVPRAGAEGDDGPSTSSQDALFDPDPIVTPKEQRRMDKFIVHALAAATEAIKDADWEPTDEVELERTGVMIGSGIGGL